MSNTCFINAGDLAQEREKFTAYLMAEPINLNEAEAAFVANGFILDLQQRFSLESVQTFIAAYRGRARGDYVSSGAASQNRRKLQERVSAAQQPNSGNGVV